MRLEAVIPLDITVNFYKAGVPGYTSGAPENCYPEESPEIEYTVRTLSGHILSEDDFANGDWDNLSYDILEAFEFDLKEAYDDAQISAREYRYLDD